MQTTVCAVKVPLESGGGRAQKKGASVEFCRSSSRDQAARDHRSVLQKKILSTSKPNVRQCAGRPVSQAYNKTCGGRTSASLR